MTAMLRNATRSTDTATLMRRGMLAIGGLGVAGTTAELIFLRHWQTPLQLIAWPPMGALAVVLLLIARRPTRRSIRWAQGLGLGVLLLSGTGVLVHVIQNLASGPLDKDYAAIWDTLSPIAQLWTAATGGVGPAPTLAPAAIAWTALILQLATLRHPALESTDASAPG
jgi:hypothetical protein